MLRAAPLSPTCLACSTPLAGALAVPAKMMGIRRSADNPNLCSRCGQHLAKGEIHPICLLHLELCSGLRFGTVNLERLSERELPALREQLRSRLEQRGGLVYPVDPKRPLLLTGYFNAPVRQPQPELATYLALTACLDWLATETASLGIDVDCKAALTTGYAELIACESPLQCVPFGQVNIQAQQLLDQARPGQAMGNQIFLSQLLLQDPDLLTAASLNPLPARPAVPDQPILLLDIHARTRSPRSWQRIDRRLPPQASGWAQVGALLLAAIAAPCAAMVALSPAAATLGLGALVAALMPMWKGVGMSLWPRILLTLSALLIAVINLVRAELLQKRFHQLQRQVGAQLQLPQVQRRRLRLIRWTSGLVLLLVAVEGILRITVMKMPLL